MKCSEKAPGSCGRIRRRKKESSEDDESFDVEMPIGKNPDEADDDFND